MGLDFFVWLNFGFVYFIGLEVFFKPGAKYVQHSLGKGENILLL